MIAKTRLLNMYTKLVGMQEKNKESGNVPNIEHHIEVHNIEVPHIDNPNSYDKIVWLKNCYVEEVLIESKNIKNINELVNGINISADDIKAINNQVLVLMKRKGNRWECLVFIGYREIDDTEELAKMYSERCSNGLPSRKATKDKKINRTTSKRFRTTWKLMFMKDKEFLNWLSMCEEFEGWNRGEYVANYGGNNRVNNENKVEKGNNENNENKENKENKIKTTKSTKSKNSVAKKVNENVKNTKESGDDKSSSDE